MVRLRVLRQHRVHYIANCVLLVVCIFRRTNNPSCILHYNINTPKWLSWHNAVLTNKQHTKMHMHSKVMLLSHMVLKYVSLRSWNTIDLTSYFLHRPVLYLI